MVYATATAADSVAVKMPEEMPPMMTVAEPVSEEAASFCVGA